LVALALAAARTPTTPARRSGSTNDLARCGMRFPLC
jgi:hypothetical protein